MNADERKTLRMVADQLACAAANHEPVEKIKRKCLSLSVTVREVVNNSAHDDRYESEPYKLGKETGQWE